MKKYNLSRIMKRAWEIKERADRKTRNSLYTRMIIREMEESEKHHSLNVSNLHGQKKKEVSNWQNSTM